MVKVRAWLECCNRKRDTSENPERNHVHIALGLFFSLNFILCTGYLGMPFVFYHAGILFAAATLVLIMFVSWNCAIWTVETISRAQVNCHNSYSAHVHKKYFTNTEATMVAPHIH